VSNWFRLTPDGRLDRQYLRVCAVYRCVVRYGMRRQAALAALFQVMPERDAKALVSVWAQTPAARTQLSTTPTT
jgi:hypothetical protein